MTDGSRSDRDGAKPHVMEYWRYRLEDIRPYHTIDALCLKCPHWSTVPHELILRGRLRSPSEFLKGMSYRFRCARCGNRGAFINLTQPTEWPS